MLVLYGRLTFQPACVFRGLNKGLNCVCVCVFRARSGWRAALIQCAQLLFLLWLAIAIMLACVQVVA